MAEVAQSPLDRVYCPPGLETSLVEAAHIPELSDHSGVLQAHAKRSFNMEVRLPLQWTPNYLRGIPPGARLHGSYCCGLSTLTPTSSPFFKKCQSSRNLDTPNNIEKTLSETESPEAFATIGRGIYRISPRTLPSSEPVYVIANQTMHNPRPKTMDGNLVSPTLSSYAQSTTLSWGQSNTNPC